MSKTYKIEETELIKLIMNYLKKRNMLKSLFALELESQVHLEGFSKEMKFFRQLIFEGSFDEAEALLNQFQSKLGENYYRALFELKKQKYFELIDQKPDVGFLIRILKEIEQLVQADVYKNLCFFLTLKSINDHPEYIDWSVQKGRMMCFEAIRPLMKALGKSFANVGDTYLQDINQVLQRLILYELAVRDDLKQSTISLSSLISMPNDIIDQQQKKIKIEFISNNDPSRERMIPVSQIYNTQNKSSIDDLLSQSVQIEKKSFQYEQSYNPIQDVLYNNNQNQSFQSEVDTPKIKL